MANHRDNREHRRYADRLATLEAQSVIDGRDRFKKRHQGLKRGSLSYGPIKSRVTWAGP